MFEPLNDLERQLMEATKDPSKRPAFQVDLLQAELFAAATPAGKEGPQTQVRGVRLQDGVRAAAVFTARERVAAAFGPDTVVVANRGGAMLSALRLSPVALNPGQEFGAVWNQDELAKMLDAGEVQAQDDGAKLSLGYPVRRPHVLIGRLQTAFQTNASVREAYLMWATRSDRPHPYWLLGVASTGSWEEVEAMVEQGVRGFDFGDNPLETVALGEGGVTDTLRRGIPVVLRTQPPPPPPKKRGLFGFKKG